MNTSFQSGPAGEGLTKQEVIDRVGRPTSIPEAGGGDVWIYQIGMDPDATSPSTEEKFLRYGRLLRRMHFTDTE
jgi:hypothetical protein